MRRRHQETDEFRERYRRRAGVEATFSELNRKTGVNNLRVRGFRAVRFAAILKAAGSGRDQVLKVTVFVANMGLWDQVNAVYARFFVLDLDEERMSLEQVEHCGRCLPRPGRTAGVD